MTLKMSISSLQDALAKTDDLVDSNFGEFKYQDQLKEQSVLTLYRLESLDTTSAFTPIVLKGLADVILVSKTMKVRIAAVSALGEINNIARFGADPLERNETLQALVASLQKALTETNEVLDYKSGELKYQDQLQNHLMLTLSRLQSLEFSSP